MPTYTGSSNADSLTGGTDADIMIGNEGADTLDGGGGADVIHSHFEAASRSYWSLDNAADVDTLFGGGGNDLLYAGYGDHVDGGSHSVRDSLLISFMGAGAGVTADFRLLASQASITIGGGTITGVEAIRRIEGSAFDDFIASWGVTSGGFTTKIQGGDGDDHIIADGSYPDLSGDDGNDILDFASAVSAGVATGGSGDDTITGSSSDDKLYGDAGNDTLYGNGGWDYLYGADGDDVLDAASGYIFGGAGADVLSGGTHLWSHVHTAPPGSYNYKHQKASYDTLAEHDVLIGNDVPNYLYAGYGDDVDGGGGDSSSGDRLFISFRAATSGVTADFRLLATEGSITIGGGTITDIEEVAFIEGSDFDDVLVAWCDPSNSIFEGGAIYGRGGNDHLIASRSSGWGDSDLYGGDGDDIIDLTAAAYSPDAYGEAGNDTIIGGDGYERLLGGAGDDSIFGNSGYDYLYGGDGSDVMDGGSFGDRLEGQGGNDILYGAGDADYITGGDGDDLIYGDWSPNGSEIKLSPASSNDILKGDAGNDTIYGDDGNDNIDGGSGDDTLYGGEGDDLLAGGAGIDWLDGGSGADTMSGGLGNDTYVVDDAGDTLSEAPEAGWDTVRTQLASYTLAADFEQLNGTSADGQSLTGNALANDIWAGSGADIIDGGAGADRMWGGAGDDIYIVDDAADYVGESLWADTDTVLSSVTYTLPQGNADPFAGVSPDYSPSVENLVLTGTAAIDGAGNALRNEITGNSAANRLDGRAGADTMTGGLGNDTYVVDDAGDQVVELAGQGADAVEASVGFTLADNIEQLTLTGVDNLDGTGNGGANSLYGNSGNNRLDGGAGADRMSGGDGDDTYIVDQAGDRVFEASAAGGLDTVYSAVDFTLAYQYLERLFLTGTAINATGNGLANVLVGNAQANVLNGMGGIDVMNGGAGDDTYIVDTIGESVIEAAGGGTDTVVSSVTFALSRSYEIENLILTGTARINAYGNHLDNRLEGNAASNILNGSTGADTMIGRHGHDIYYVDDAGDVVIEAAGEGNDTVHASVSHTLAANVETLALTGTAANGTGNDLANRLYGNASDNILDGGAGADTMIGRGGNDTYIVDNVGDRVLETNAAEGTADRILASVSYSLGGIHVETLELTGTAAIDATGNGLANTLIGNVAANKLYGLAGDDALDGGGGHDQLTGGAGHDTLTGGAGKDVFRFDSALSQATNVDQILDFSVADDAIYLDRSIFTALGAGTLSASAFVNGTAAADANDRIVYDGATGNIWYDADGSGAGAQVLFATVTAGTALTNLDFYGYG